MNKTRLWAPWRLKYVQGQTKKSCIFCDAVRDPKADHVVFTTDSSICLLNIYPYNNGHVMIAPRRHVKSLAQFTDGQLIDLWRSVERAQRLLEAAIRPHGFNVGINFERVAGAGIPGHLHVHVVPRWNGDTNFMPVIGGTKVISQSLQELHKLLIDADTKKSSGLRK